MIIHQEKKVLPYSAKKMFELVIDVNKYPIFVPWCSNVNIRSRIQADEIGSEYLYADLEVSFKIYKEIFLSKILANSSKFLIEINHEEGPFKVLKNKWTFLPVDENSCEVNLEVMFEFKSFILQKAVGIFFYDAVKRIIVAFENRAKEIYK